MLKFSILSSVWVLEERKPENFRVMGIMEGIILEVKSEFARMGE